MSYKPKDRNERKLKEYLISNRLQLKMPFNSFSNETKELLWYEITVSERKEFSKNYPDLAKEYKKADVAIYVYEKKQKNPLIKFSNNIRFHMHRYLKGKKNKKSEEILGMTFKEFQQKIGVKKKGVHLDHIIPLSWANSEEEIYCLNHYSNFQLLDAFENRSKSNRYCLRLNLSKVLEKHNNKALVQKILDRNKDKILK
tara:strand:+ start:692 stop:1288 length:597 start_codon:yes stop_codon:yes gene_type:complete